jgi:hypothetical protein
VIDSIRWQLTDPGLVWREWPEESEVVAFSPSAGSVHLLSLSARALLQELVRGPLTPAGIAQFIASDTGLASTVVDAALPELLQMLRDAELIQPAWQ